MSAYYNEIDPEKAEWLRELIRQNVTAPGEVDERSIEKVEAADLRGFRQCHFFAGIGVWSYALRLAGWPDDRPVWTGSCPCPSFSAAGKGQGFDDPRHLWPAWYRLIPESNPPTIFGEQADDAIGYGWLDLVQTDLERAHYAVGKAVLGACSVGAPHIRQRLYFVAHSEHSGHDRSRWFAAVADCNEPQERVSDGNRSLEFGSHPEPGRLQQHDARQRELRESSAGCKSLLGANADGVRRSGRRFDYGGNSQGEWIESPERSGLRQPVTPRSDAFDGSDPSQRGLAMHRSTPGDAGHFALTSQPGIESISEGLEGFSGDVREWRGPGWLDPHTARSIAAAGATRGFWRDCDWWHARDEKYRPIERGLFPLVTGASNRVLKLRGYGDAIVSEVAKAFIEAYLEIDSHEQIEHLGSGPIPSGQSSETRR